MPAFDNTIPINVDINATRRTYSDLAHDHLLVTSIFYTIQGEGPYAGHPAVFVRLAGCNFGAKDVACHGCDTAFPVSGGRAYAVHDLAAHIDFLSRSRTGARVASLVVITGGEPLLQPTAALSQLLRLLDDASLRVQIETNGTQRPALSYLLSNSSATFVVSPKPLVRTGYANAAPSTSPYVYYKFLVCSEPSSHHYDLPVWAYALPPSQVYVSPVTVYRCAPAKDAPASAWDPAVVDQPATSLNYRRAAELALSHGFLVSVQTHTFLGIA